jgi:N-acetylglucosaminyldiphosphoundecaprenol N-acetyl-beta-D-mannosaminyltransferase
LKRAEATGRSVFFYGTTDDLLNRIAKKAEKEFPALKISGYYAPPFRPMSDEETAATIKLIKSTSPDMVFVALGCPKQEYWMADHKLALDSCLLGLGQAFRVYAGVEKRLPQWMRNLSLEWVYRFYLEPGRLWKRYLTTNTYFLWLSACHLMRKFVRKHFPNVVKAKFSGE